ncbi:hypothetical protein HT576_23855 [Haloterrigena sp. SYSU A121-1]|uniref:DUF7311 domain-containing protein n=1 Tax=Haloterrigena gelatinilytica TaxID=2741724 RepID=A0A8J8GPP8_9EURY|nr:hypothetical protein [Haloterrigena gelatinilytica]NUB94013.1 hypothetical protein [Haloterrigena gelatinilytica]
MIRYVLAAALSLALLAAAVPALEYGAAINTERTLDTGIEDLDRAATSLAANDDPTPDTHPDPQRVVTVSLPEDSLTTAGVDHFEVVPREDGNFSAARYVLEDGTTRTATIDERIVWLEPTENEPIELGGTGERELVLTLEMDANDEPVVVARRA